MTGQIWILGNRVSKVLHFLSIFLIYVMKIKCVENYQKASLMKNSKIISYKGFNVDIWVLSIKIFAYHRRFEGGSRLGLLVLGGIICMEAHMATLVMEQKVSLSNI